MDAKTPPPVAPPPPTRIVDPLPEQTKFDLSRLRGPNCALMGAIGTGKTYCISTLIEAGYKVCCVFTEPGGEESLIDALNRKSIKWEGKLFWRYIAPSAPTWNAFRDISNMVHTMSYDDLSHLKAGLKKPEHFQFLTLVDACANFVDDNSGKRLGAIDLLPNNYAFVLDSLSGLNIMALELSIGAKPSPHQGEWGVAMAMEEKLINMLCSNTKPLFVMTAHLDPGINPEVGQTKYMMGALGNKLAPKLPRFFGDVIQTNKQGTEFFWSTTSSSVDLKNRLLPTSGKLKPDFVQIRDAWIKRYNLNLDEWLRQEPKK